MIVGLMFAMFTAVQDTNVMRLPTVEVKVGREPARSALELPFALTRIVPDSIRPGMRNASIDERLFLLPGVVVSSRNNPSQDPRVSIRGFGSRSAFGVRGVRVQMDGVPLTLPDGQSAVDYLDLESIGSLEVIRGSAASLYGNAAGGVIDMRSRAFPAASFEPSLTAWMGNNSQYKIAASVGGTRGNTEYAVSLSRMQTDGVRLHSEQEVTNASLRLGSKLGAVRIGLGLLAHDMPLAENPGALTLGEMLADTAGPDKGFEAAAPNEVRRNARKEVSQVQAGLTIGTGSAEAKGELEIVLYGGARDLYNPLTFGIVGVERTSHGASIRASRKLSLFSRPALFTLGVDYQKQNDDRTQHANCNGEASATANCPEVGVELGVLQRDQKELITGIGPFVRGEIELSDRLILSSGVRADNIRFEVRDALITQTNPDDSGERTLSAVSPMVGLVYRAGPLVSLYANYSTAFETPTATELGNQPDGSAGFNQELDPQRAATVEAGTRGWMRTSVLPRGLNFDVALYQTSVEDELIPFEDPLGQGRRFFRNAGSTVRIGAEASLSTEVGPATFAVAYGYSHFTFEDYQVTEGGTTSVFDDKRIPGIPLQQFQGSVTLRKSAWYLTVEGETRGSVYVNDANAVQSAGYETMNVRLGGEGVVGLRWLSPRFGIQNVFDRKYAASVSVNAAGGRYFEPAAGRTIYGGLTIRGVR